MMEGEEDEEMGNPNEGYNDEHKDEVHSLKSMS
jgi:hypothetical protein